MARIYVSSTYSDLKEVRQQVMSTLTRLDHKDVAMEHYVAGPERPLDRCLADVESCDLYIGIFAWRYGFIPPGHTESITELEYRKARDKKKTCLIFLLHEDAKWPVTSIELEANKRMKLLRKELEEEHVVDYFTSEEDIGGLVAVAIARWEKETKERASKNTLTKYLEFLVTTNNHVSNRGIAQMVRPTSTKIEDLYVPLSADPVLMDNELTDIDHELPRLTPLGGSTEGTDDTAFSDYGLLAYVTLKTTAQIIRENKHILILGEPGSGKTMLVRFLTLQFALAAQRLNRAALLNSPSSNTQSDDLTVQDKYGNDYGQVRLPIMIRVADFADAFSRNRNLSLREFIPSAFGAIGVSSEAIATLFHEAQAAGNALVLLDGLDEIIDVTDRSRIARRIEEFVGGIDSNNHVLVTSRTAGYKSVLLGGEFAHFKLRGMDRAQIKQFLQSFYWVAEKPRETGTSKPQLSPKSRAKVNTILKAVNKNASLQRLARNPLMLTILSLNHSSGAGLPNQRVEIYEFAIRTLLQDWQLARGIPKANTVKLSEALRLLGPLAYWMHTNKPSGLASEQEVRERLAEWLAATPNTALNEEDAQDLVQNFMERTSEHTGIFVERAPGQYGFMHLTFEEYFVAKELIRRNDNLASFIYSHKSDPRWEEPILLAMGLLSKTSPDKVEAYIRTSILAEGEQAKKQVFTQSPFEDLLHRDKIFAAMCIGDCTNISTELRRQVLGKLIAIYLDAKGSCRFEPLRERIASCLGSLSSNEAVEEAEHLLYEAMTDERASVRSRALLAAAKLNVNSQEVTARFEAALQDRNAEVRRNAIMAIIESQAFSATEDALLESLKDKNVGVRIQSAYALAELKSETPRVVKSLLDAFNDANNQVRRSAIRAIGEMGLKTPHVCNALTAALNDSNRAVQIEAARVLAALGLVNPYVIRMLLESATNGNIPSRSNAIWALVELNSDAPEILEALLSFLEDRSSYIRSTAARALVRTELSLPEVLNALLAAIGDEDSSVRSSAIWTLGGLKIGKQEVISALTAKVKEDDETLNVRKQAIRTLVKMRATATVVRNALIDALKNSDAEIRRFAVWALGELNFATPNSIKSRLAARLTETLNDKNKAVAAQSAYAMVKLRFITHQVTQKVMLALNDEDKNLRVLSARALTEICAGESVLNQADMGRILTELHKELLEQRNHSDVFSGRYYLHVYDVMWEALWVASSALKCNAIASTDPNYPVTEMMERVIV